MISKRTHWSFQPLFIIAGANDLAGFILPPVNGPFITESLLKTPLSVLNENNNQDIRTTVNDTTMIRSAYLIGVESFFFSFRGSQTLQVTNIRREVATNSRMKAWARLKSECTTVEQKPQGPEFVLYKL